MILLQSSVKQNHAFFHKSFYEFKEKHVHFLFIFKFRALNFHEILFVIKFFSIISSIIFYNDFFNFIFSLIKSEFYCSSDKCISVLRKFYLVKSNKNRFIFWLCLRKNTYFLTWMKYFLARKKDYTSFFRKKLLISFSPKKLAFFAAKNHINNRYVLFCLKNVFISSKWFFLRVLIIIRKNTFLNSD